LRLFIAIEIPAGVRENIAAVRKRFVKPHSEMRWVRPENFHVTLKFIGEVLAEQTAAISDALRSVPSHAPMALSFRGLGWYWNAKGFGMLYASIEADDSLAALGKTIDQCLVPLSIPADNRSFLPHLTLARCKSREHRSRAAVPADIHSIGEAYKGHDFGAVHAEQFHLIESKLGLGGSKYSTVASFPFTRTASA
jgi:2'-5' RNA ligase